MVVWPGYVQQCHPCPSSTGREGLPFVIWVDNIREHNHISQLHSSRNCVRMNFEYVLWVEIIKLSCQIIIVIKHHRVYGVSLATTCRPYFLSWFCMIHKHNGVPSGGQALLVCHHSLAHHTPMWCCSGLCWVHWWQSSHLSSAYGQCPLQLRDPPMSHLLPCLSDTTASCLQQLVWGQSLHPCKTNSYIVHVSIWVGNHDKCWCCLIQSLAC